MTLNVLDILVIFGAILVSDFLSIGIVLWSIEIHRRSTKVTEESIATAVDTNTAMIGAVSKRVSTLEGWRWTVEHPAPRDLPPLPPEPR